MMKEGMKTPAAELADIVLPAATWLEVDQVVTVPFVANNVALAQQKVARVGESRPDEEVFAEGSRSSSARSTGRSLRCAGSIRIPSWRSTRTPPPGSASGKTTGSGSKQSAAGSGRGRDSPRSILEWSTFSTAGGSRKSKVRNTESENPTRTC